MTLWHIFKKWFRILMLSRGGRKMKNYKSSGNSQSSNTTNLAIILSQMPRKSQFIRPILPENEIFPGIREVSVWTPGPPLQVL